VLLKKMNTLKIQVGVRTDQAKKWHVVIAERKLNYSLSHGGLDHWIFEQPLQ
jgi:hypothetical protein